MTLLAVITISTLACLLLVQIFLAGGFARRVKNPRRAPPPKKECPKAAVVICVRGSDPALEGCLRSALAQDYPNYAVHIIVDSKTDPAWLLVKKIARNCAPGKVAVHVLAKPLDSCSLKCSSLIQVFATLGPSYEVVALLDIDVAPHSRWLHALVAPLSDPAVGATTGNRWFSPDPRSSVDIARHAWNAAAVVLMYWLGVAWGGSLAIRRSVIDKGGLLEQWSRSYGDDTSINPALRQLGLNLEFVPSAILVGQGGTSSMELTDWVTRQLQSCRLHHRGWWGVVIHGAITTAALVAGTLVLAAGVIEQQWPVAISVSASLFAYFGTMILLLTWMESIVAGVFETINGTVARPKISRSFYKLFCAVVYAQLVYARALVNAMFTRSIKWRGICYQIYDESKIRMAEYRPLRNVRHHTST